MSINSKSLHNLPVRTRSGQPVGKVASVDIDADTGKLVALRVKTRGIVPGLLDQELSVAWGQIVEITEKEVIVEDGTVPMSNRAMASASPAVSRAGSALASEAADS